MKSFYLLINRVRSWSTLGAALLITLGSALGVSAEVRLPNIFGDNMVLQRDKPIRVWGLSGADEQIAVTFAGKSKSTTASTDGRWELDLDAEGVSIEPRELVVRGARNEVVFRNVVVGDVWVLGGQSNMEAALENIRDGDLELASADLPNVRLMTVPHAASTTPLDDFPRIDEYSSWSKVTERKGDWMVCSSDTLGLFSAVGYIFGRRIYLATGVPIGLIDTSWGGTTVEAWISRDTLATIPEARPVTESWDSRIAAYDPQESLAELIERWEVRAKRMRAEGKPTGERPTEPKPSPAVDRNNPGAAYNAMIRPFAGLSVKGAIFYQGINNAVGGARPSLYTKTFAALIPEWRRTFRDAQMPFGIIQMVSWGFPPTLEETEVAMVSMAPYIREAQLKAHLSHPDTGFVVAYDLGHIQMHSPFKTPLGERLARWALATQYGRSMNYKTPIYQSMKIDGNRSTVTFDEPIHPLHGGRAMIQGFAIAGKDRHFYPATAVMSANNAVEVSSDFVLEPVAVRYAWATHPFGTLVGASSRGLPAAPFRTDDWPWRDTPVGERSSPDVVAHNRWMKEQREQAQTWARERAIQQARAVLEKLEAEK